jgi:peptidoglycan glycosyltransferase
MALLFGLLFVQLTYVQVIDAERISAHPANAGRQIVAEYQVRRGPILTHDGLVIARSQRAERDADLRFVRIYPEGPTFAHLTGYYSRIYGRSALEQAMNPFLAGDAPELAASNLSDLILGRTKEGGQVITTIDGQLQRRAMELLQGLETEAAVAAINPMTGDLLALASTPTFDPNRLAQGSADEIEEYWERLNEDPGKPLLSKAKDELYLPGSAFKMTTASTAIEDGYPPRSVWPNPRELDLPQTDETLENFEGGWCAGGARAITLELAFTISCNVTFGEIGLELGADRLSAGAHAFGFCRTDPPGQTTCEDQTIPFILPFQAGRFPVPSYFEDRQGAIALSATGLDNDLTNPMHLALIAGTIANGGIMMQPRLVAVVRDPQGRIIREFGPTEYARPISAETAAQMRRMMTAVVETPAGTGNLAQVPGVTVAGKTGTATAGEGQAPNAWFAGFAPSGPGQIPTIAVAVIVLDGGGLGQNATGGTVAAPIAREMIEAYLGVS